jgi:hypothetical protein
MDKDKKDKSYYAEGVQLEGERLLVDVPDGYNSQGEKFDLTQEPGRIEDFTESDVDRSLEKWATRPNYFKIILPWLILTVIVVSVILFLYFLKTDALSDHHLVVHSLVGK